MAEYGRGAPLSGAFVALGGATFLALLCAVRRTPIWAGANWTLRVRVGILEAVNLTSFVAALHLAPLAIAVPLHLAAPVFLLLREAMRRERRWRDAAAELGLVGLGLACLGLVAGADQQAASIGGLVVGCALALVSGASVAALILQISTGAKASDPAAAAFWQLLFAAAVSAATFPWSEHVDSAGASVLFLAGALFLGPAFAVYWYALRTVKPALAALLGLNEAIMAVLFGLVFFHGRLNVWIVLSGLIVLAACAHAIVQRSTDSRHLGDAPVTGQDLPS
jgi:drug/metabolite transporter (DMT)-like permease